VATLGQFESDFQRIAQERPSKQQLSKAAQATEYSRQWELRKIDHERHENGRKTAKQVREVDGSQT